MASTNKSGAQKSWEEASIGLLCPHVFSLGPESLAEWAHGPRLNAEMDEQLAWAQGNPQNSTIRTSPAATPHMLLPRSDGLVRASVQHDGVPVCLLAACQWATTLGFSLGRNNFPALWPKGGMAGTAGNAWAIWVPMPAHQHTEASGRRVQNATRQPNEALGNEALMPDRLTQR